MAKKSFDFIGKRKIFLLISVALLVAGLLINLIMGTELDINFKGGAVFTYSLTGEKVDEAGVTAIAQKHLGDGVEVDFAADLAGKNTQVTFTLTDIPSTVLTYQVVGTPDVKVLAQKGQEVFGCETKIEYDATAKTVTADPVEVVTDSMVADYTAAIKSTDAKAPQYTFVSANTVSELADLMLADLVKQYGTVLNYTVNADTELVTATVSSETPTDTPTDTEQDAGTTISSSEIAAEVQSALYNLNKATSGNQVNVTVNNEAHSFAVTPIDAGREFTEEEMKAITTALQTKFDKAGVTASTQNNNGVTLITSNSVKPTVGKGFFIKCLFAMVLGGLFLTLYIGIRFRKIGGVSAGLFATFALIHDILIAYMAYVIFRIPLDDNFIAVVLTILGYSINGTIVIYDRIRENEQKFGSSLTINEIVNRSVNETFARNVFTSLSTLIAVVAIAVVAWFNGLTSIISFAFPMAVGILSGFYSSVLLSSPMWAWWRTRKLNK